MLIDIAYFLICAGNTLLFCIYLIAAVANTAAFSKTWLARMANLAFAALLLGLYQAPGMWGTISLPLVCLTVAAGGAWLERRSGQACNCLGDMSQRYRHLISPIRYLTFAVGATAISAALVLHENLPQAVSVRGVAAGVGLFVFLLYRYGGLAPRPLPARVAPVFDGWAAVRVHAGAMPKGLTLQEIARSNGGIVLLFTNDLCKPCQQMQPRIDLLRAAFGLDARLLYTAPEGHLYGDTLGESDRRTLIGQYDLRATPSGLYLSGSSAPEPLIGEIAVLTRLMDLALASRRTGEPACA